MFRLHVERFMSTGTDAESAHYSDVQRDLTAREARSVCLLGWYPP